MELNGDNYFGKRILFHNQFRPIVDPHRYNSHEWRGYFPSFPEQKILSLPTTLIWNQEFHLEIMRIKQDMFCSLSVDVGNMFDSFSKIYFSDMYQNPHKIPQNDQQSPNLLFQKCSKVYQIINWLTFFIEKCMLFLFFRVTEKWLFSKW